MSLPFAHLHNHTEFSILDGLGTVESYAQRAVELGQSHLAITDHGVLCGLPSFYHACRKTGVEPILGSEFYYVPDASWRPAKGQQRQAKDPDAARYHVVILARGRSGYQVLSELSTASHRNFYHKPLLDRATIESLGDATNHLVCLSGCANSLISKKAVNESEESAAEEMMWWREMFPRFYIEVQHHGTAFDQQLNESLLRLAYKYSVPWVVTNDPHYVDSKDACHHDALLAIQTAADIDDPQRFRFDGTGYHLKSRAEMRKAFRSYPEQVWKLGAANTNRIARDCEVRIPEWEARTWQIPRFPDTDDPRRLLRRLARRGLKAIGRMHDEEYVQRVERELDVFAEVGIEDFLLITRWIVQQAAEAGIPVGPGRGSVCGSLVGYLIGIHKIDPIRYDLLFERFLNPSRPRMPDIDTDFGQARRSEVFQMIIDKFGEENVVGVCTYSRMHHKKAFQSLAKAHGISFPDRVRISKEMPSKPTEGQDIIPPEIRQDFPDLVVSLERLQGVRSALGGHPAGVIISSPESSIRSLVPEMWLVSSKKMCGQYDLEAVEDMGLMKQDCLGLRTLDTIDLCLRYVEERTGSRPDPDSWVPDEEEQDDEVWAMLAEGKTAGVFQMEGGTNTAGIIKIAPVGFEDVVSCTALYRTGPILAGYPEQFLSNREVGKKRIRYLHPLLKPILERTWGVILYQEQVMEIGKMLAGFDDAGQDEIKEAIKHKKSTIMDTLRPVFVQGCSDTHSIPPAISTAIWKIIEGYAGYGYNRSHAVAYTMTTYHTARLKLLYPVEFLAALMATVEDDASGKDKIESYRREAVSRGIRLLPPDVNASSLVATPEGGAIRMGLTDFKGVGASQAGKVVGKRPEGGYTSVQDVEDAVRNTGAMHILRSGGALKTLGVPADLDAQDQLLNWQFRDGMKKWRKELRSSVDFPREDADWCTIAGEITHSVRSQTKAGKPFITWTVRWSPQYSWKVRMWSETAKHWSLPRGSVVRIMGKYEAKWDNISVSNPRMVEVIHRGRAEQGQQKRTEGAADR